MENYIKMGNVDLKFTLQDWNREYGELSTIEDTLWYYRYLFEDKLSAKISDEKLINIETWAHYAFDCNKSFVCRIREKELDPNKAFELYSDIEEKESRELYITALLNDNQQPYACIRFSGIFVVIEYIDKYNRVYMTYSFRTEYGQSGLFLYELEYFIYPEDAEEFDVDNRDYVSYYFTPEGGLTLTKEYNVGTSEHTKETFEAEQLVNIEKNWEPYPEFGQWDGIVKMKRWEVGELAMLFDEQNNKLPIK
jgi:hypothetical protein